MKKIICLFSLSMLLFQPLMAGNIPVKHIEKLKEDSNPKWFIGLPLRFTHIQNTNTMLSGITIGRMLNTRFSVSLSVYHTFYLKSFKPQVSISGLEPGPRLFVNGVGIEPGFRVFDKRKVSGFIQLMAGWGFMKYDLKEKNFSSRQVNYLVLEPSFVTAFRINASTSLVVGFGYRPLPSNKSITYSSHVSDGYIPLEKRIPNGLNVLVTLQGRF